MGAMSNEEHAYWEMQNSATLATETVARVVMGIMKPSGQGAALQCSLLGQEYVRHHITSQAWESIADSGESFGNPQEMHSEILPQIESAILKEARWQSARFIYLCEVHSKSRKELLGLLDMRKTQLSHDFHLWSEEMEETLFD